MTFTNSWKLGVQDNWIMSNWSELKLQKYNCVLTVQNYLRITGHLGSGQFGSVEQGVWKRQGTKPVDVALKSLTKTSEEDRVKFLQEAAIMAQFKHPNVIVLHGVITNKKPVRPRLCCIVLPLGLICNGNRIHKHVEYVIIFCIATNTAWYKMTR